MHERRVASRRIDFLEKLQNERRRSSSPLGSD
jgi:hypothetical protein